MTMENIKKAIMKNMWLYNESVKQYKSTSQENKKLCQGEFSAYWNILNEYQNLGLIKIKYDTKNDCIKDIVFKF